jgi:hypothetical protein
LRYLIGRLWRNALRYALKGNLERTAVTVIGHTHTYGKHELAKGFIWVDGGDMQKDRGYLGITEQGAEHLWTLRQCRVEGEYVFLITQTKEVCNANDCHF